MTMITRYKRKNYSSTHMVMSLGRVSLVNIIGPEESKTIGAEIATAPIVI